jgi:hypothetical protein
MPTAETIELALALARNAPGLIGIARLRLRQMIVCRRWTGCGDCPG